MCASHILLSSDLRRERNRMHAKMTRDRKRSFIASLKRVISKLEEDNQHLRETLEKYRATEDKSGDNPIIDPLAVSDITSPSSFQSNMYTIG